MLYYFEYAVLQNIKMDLINLIKYFEKKSDLLKWE